MGRKEKNAKSAKAESAAQNTAPPAPLLGLVTKFLQSHGYSKAVSAITKQSTPESISTIDGLPGLEQIWQQWQDKQAAAGATKELQQEVMSESESGTSSGSEDEDEDEDKEEAVGNSSSSSDNDSDSDSDTSMADAIAPRTSPSPSPDTKSSSPAAETVPNKMLKRKAS
ncbi:hypothetical protein LTR28_004919, partial [Elasticomyces elasticus]